jgi:hypothetical protein
MVEKFAQSPESDDHVGSQRFSLNRYDSCYSVMKTKTQALGGDFSKIS